MIWHDGRILPASEVKVDLDDRTFEHGLGLFETMRTFSGRAPLLGPHLDRLRSSAAALGLSLEGVTLPDQDAVTNTIAANSLSSDALLRITMTGGSPRKSPVLWMTARPLPPVEPHPRVLLIHPHPLVWPDNLGSHKTLNYWSRRMAHEWAAIQGAIDCLLTGPDGRVWEASRNNVAFISPEQPRTLVTPELNGPIVPGIMRQVVLDFAREHGYKVEERAVFLDELRAAESIFLTNSVRGVRAIDDFDRRTLTNQANSELLQLLTVTLLQSFAHNFT